MYSWHALAAWEATASTDIQPSPSWPYRARTVLGVILACALGLAAAPLPASGAGSRARGGGLAVGSAVTEGFTELGHLDLRPAVRFGDLAVFDHGPSVGTYAYVGTSINYEVARSCGRGVKIVDVSDPTLPRLVATAKIADPGVVYEDVAVARIGDRDVLAVGIQSFCSEDAPRGLALFDVSDPAAPVQLSFLSTPFAGIHELDLAVRPDGRAIVVGAVPHSEREGTGGDVVIIEVTDPEHPVQLADWGIVRDSSLPIVGGDAEIEDQDAGIGGYASNLAHNVRAADDGMTAYASHWDAGVLKFDLSDPANPVLLGRTTFDVTEDGDAHSMTTYEVAGTRYILQNNEEITALSPPVITSSATGERELPGLENHFMPSPLSSLGEVTGDVFDANDGCEASDFDGAAGSIALFDNHGVGCSLGGQVVRALRSGAAGFLINYLGGTRPTFFRLFPGPRAFGIIAEEGEGVPSAMFSELDGGAAAIRAELATGPVTVTLTPTEPSWGFLEIFSESNAIERDGVLEYRQVGEFSALPHVVGELEQPGSWFTIHNTEVAGSRAYSSWYSHGIVALDLTDPANPILAGRFRPPDAMFWGVDVDPTRGLVFGSDMASGLWILQPTGASAPS